RPRDAADFLSSSPAKPTRRHPEEVARTCARLSRRMAANSVLVAILRDTRRFAIADASRRRSLRPRTAAEGRLWFLRMTAEERAERDDELSSRSVVRPWRSPAALKICFWMRSGRRQELHRVDRHLAFADLEVQLRRVDVAGLAGA